MSDPIEASPQQQDAEYMMLHSLLDLRWAWDEAYRMRSAPIHFRGEVQSIASNYEYDLINLPDTLEASLGEIDPAGAPLSLLLARADEFAWRDGACVLWVHPGQQVKFESETYVARWGGRPRVRLYERVRLLDYQTRIVGNSLTLLTATLLDGGNLRTFDTEHMELRTPEGELLETGEVNGVVPLVWYDLTCLPFGEAPVPLLPLYGLCQRFSDLWERCMNPDELAAPQHWQQLEAVQRMISDYNVEGLSAQFARAKEDHFACMQALWCHHTREEPSGQMIVCPDEMDYELEAAASSGN